MILSVSSCMYDWSKLLTIQHNIYQTPCCI